MKTIGFGELFSSNWELVGKILPLSTLISHLLHDEKKKNQFHYLQNTLLYRN